VVGSNPTPATTLKTLRPSRPSRLALCRQRPRAGVSERGDVRSVRLRNQFSRSHAVIGTCRPAGPVDVRNGTCRDSDARQYFLNIVVERFKAAKVVDKKLSGIIVDKIDLLLPLHVGYFSGVLQILLKGCVVWNVREFSQIGSARHHVCVL